MKLKDELMLREVAGQWIVVPLGTSVVEVNGIITLTASAALLWKSIQAGGIESADDLAKVLLSEYSVDEATARQDAQEFLDQLNEKGLIDG